MSLGAERQDRQAARIARVWHVLDTVLDPEVPALSVCDLGIVRAVQPLDDAADGLLEIFNVFNHANYGSYAGTSSSSAAGEVSRNYLQPTQNRNLAYAPRMLQLGFRVAF